jgi:hypothetical protein
MCCVCRCCGCEQITSLPRSERATKQASKHNTNTGERHGSEIRKYAHMHDAPKAEIEVAKKHIILPGRSSHAKVCGG